MMNENNNFEESMKDLEVIVEKLEAGEQNLEKSIQLFEQGVEISKRLNDQLKNAEKKVSELMNISNESKREA
ncbi:MAG: exodeoxyribonuclease VII small subunit [bacterium TMED144]|nr:MAG: exodeoxyribonuclease VII small subunit [bacterium TMED144]